MLGSDWNVRPAGVWRRNRRRRRAQRSGVIGTATLDVGSRWDAPWWHAILSRAGRLTGQPRWAVWKRPTRGEPGAVPPSRTRPLAAVIHRTPASADATATAGGVAIHPAIIDDDGDGSPKPGMLVDATPVAGAIRSGTVALGSSSSGTARAVRRILVGENKPASTGKPSPT
jgi:hypothetical protein